MRVLLGLYLLLWVPLNLFAYDPANPDVKNSLPSEIAGMKVENHLGQKINLFREFLDEDGNKVALGDYFKPTKPVLLSLVYYKCPTLCNFHLTGLNNMFKGFEWNLGDKFEYIAVSIDPNEKPDLAKVKKKAFVDDYSKSGKGRNGEGWHFLSDNADAVKELAAELGFPYRYNPGLKQWIHPAVVFIITPDGKISRYLQGIMFTDTDLKFSIMEASDGKVGGVIDKFIMYCYQFDPTKNRYAVYAMNIMKLGAGLTILILGIFLIQFWYKNSRKMGEVV
jgi:protein SCO1